MCTSVQCSRENILVRYLHQKQSSVDLRGEMLGQLVVTVEQISTSLAHVFNIILHGGNVPLNSNKQGSINKTNNSMPVSLTSVTCKLLGKQKIGGISHQT